MVFPSNLEITCNDHGVWKFHSFPFVDIGVRLEECRIEEELNTPINPETKDIPIVPKKEQKVWKALSSLSEEEEQEILSVIAKYHIEQWNRKYLVIVCKKMDSEEGEHYIARTRREIN